ncbi:MAG: hypothetical protein FP825_13780 [Hyphomonas sp.]|uniref:hypothetical protein n=1 Tax=Hyphomonas sp. TaxID=87 RepID=UPI00181E3816|nr:hypothetical protein [Hyphomonas sp.]MBA3069537.1 hypothetical protein [Hyphomonas sp.]MBU4063302.1 hypothetical protein [Alphaproteobacteria bacterium]
MKIFVKAAAIAAGVYALSACTSTEKVAVEKPSDFNLSCTEIEGEFSDLDKIMEDASDDKGVNTANVAAVVFFWPAAVGNYMNAADAEKLVEKRRSHLMDLYEKKGCVAPE